MQTIFNLLIKFLSGQEQRILDIALHNNGSDRKDSFDRTNYLYWERQAWFWGHYPSPIRPSQNDLEIYETFLKGRDSAERVLILGATPELRDLVFRRFPGKIYLADFSHRMLFEMLRFTRYVDPAREIWIKANWLELSLPDGFFDVILGDLVLQQFPPELEGKFLEKMARLLKPSGRFFGRFHFLHPKMKEPTLQEIVTKVLEGKGDEGQKITLLKFHMLWRYAEPEYRKLNREVSAREFERFVRESGLHHTVVDSALASLLVKKNSYRNWSPPGKKKLIEMLSRDFDIVSMRSANDHELARYYPLMELKSR